VDKDEVIVEGKITFDQLDIVTNNQAWFITRDSIGDVDKTTARLFEILYPVTFGVRKYELNKTLRFKFSGEITH
jgi:hypothetical protein